MKSDLIKKEVEYLESLKRKKDYAIKLGNVLFRKKTEEATMFRTQVALRQIHNTMKQLLVVIGDIRVMRGVNKVKKHKKKQSIL